MYISGFGVRILHSCQFLEQQYFLKWNPRAEYFYYVNYESSIIMSKNSPNNLSNENITLCVSREMILQTLLHFNVWVSKNQSNLTVIFSLWLLLLSFWYILISYCKSIMQWGILGVGTMILSDNIHNNARKVTLIFADSHFNLRFVLKTTKTLVFVFITEIIWRTFLT